MSDFKWSDIFSSSSEEDEENFLPEQVDGEEEEFLKEFKDEIDMTKVDSDKTIDCSCCFFDDKVSALEFLKTTDPDPEMYRCVLNTLTYSVNYMLKNCTELNDVYRLAFCDNFYRFRHEFLFKLVCLTLNHPYEKSDMSFRTLGIESDRTPDLIIVNEKIILIIEISASSSFERAAVSKGLEEAGFESKYKKELDMLDEINLKYIYVPLLFDMANVKNMEYEKGIEKISGILKINDRFFPVLQKSKEILCIISLQSKSYFTPPSNILFSKSEYIKKNHEELSFMYVLDNKEQKPIKIYKEFYISPPVYGKVINNWHRLTEMCERYLNDEKLNLILDTSSHKMFYTNFDGKFTKSEFVEAINDNDKLKLFSMLKLKVGRKVINASDSSDGIKFIETTNETFKTDFSEVEKISDHCPKLLKIKPTAIDLIKYKEMLDRHFSYNYKYILGNKNFEEDFINKICNNDKSQVYDKNKDNNFYKPATEGLLSEKELESLDIQGLFEELKGKQVIINRFDESIPVRINKNKNPFILPIAQITKSSYTDLKYKSTGIFIFLKEKIEVSDPYTFHILDEILCDDFEFIHDLVNPSETYNSLKVQKQEVSREISQLSREFYKSQDSKFKIKLRETKDEKFKDEFQRLNKKMMELTKSLERRSKIEKIKNETQLIRLPTKNKKTFLGKKFVQEMEHYRDKNVQSTIKGVGIRDSIITDYKNEREVYDNITEWLTGNAGDNPNLFFEDIQTDDCKLLKELKNAAVEEYEALITSVKNSFLGHSSAFVSNLAHSLLYYSQLPFNSDYIRVDNLGYKNVLLIVRGGKKIFKSKSSKMFRLLYPINESIIPWIENGKGSVSSSKIFNYEGENYLLTPWSQMHESTLNDSISFYTRVVSFTVLNLNPKIKFQLQFSKVSFNVMLSFHNRRHTEVILANLRYILLATLGDYTGISEIFEEFLGFNYDCFQSFVRNSVLINYPEYFNNLKKIKDIKAKIPNFSDYIKESPTHLFTGSKITCEEDLALMVYSTFLMTKAPYQRPAERARNLKGILKIHELFDQMIGLNNNMIEFNEKTSIRMEDFDNLEDYSKEIFSNDFYFDPSYCSQLGIFADSYYLCRNLKEDIFVTWNQILNQSWDELATSTGLRGRFDDLSNFWGQKGYFVVYKDLVKDSNYMDSIRKLFEINLDIDKKRKLLRNLNVIYKAKLDDVKEYLIFHAVDKVQWRGGREIYVMDIETKTVQQPIEKFMGYLCKKLDNELISIPSDRRAQVIHHSIFEKDLPMKDTLTWYLTLDCSKWAPKSNYFKFISTILSMSVIPPTFKTHFMNYCQKLFKKRIYFNEAEVEVLKNNEIYRKIVEKYLKYDEVHKGYYLYMQYSWVMGIFNYTSSFLHALNQKYSEYIIFKTGLLSFHEETSLKMFAHSDDSGGRVTCSNKFMLKRCLTLYELQLKMCNHLLSKKKSVVSRFYFEILSVIYIFKKLLALLPKFLGGLRFTPSDKGPAQDMLTSYSKCIEVMVAGASFNVAYMVMKFYSYMVYRFYYHSRKPNKFDFKSPVQYLGLPDSHPLMVLLCGSDSDIVRILNQGGREDLITEHASFEKLIKTIDDEGPIKPIKFNISVRGLKKGFESYIDEFSEILNSWSIMNVNFHSTPFNLMSFLKKLSDPGFVGSLVNESTTRRLSRAYYMRKGNCVTSTLGDITLETLTDFKSLLKEDGKKFLERIDGKVFGELMAEVNEYRSVSEKQIMVLEEALVSPLRICRYMDELSLSGRQVIPSSRTLKPTHIELIKSSRVFTSKFDPAQMVSYIKEPEISWALPQIRNLFTGKKEVEKLCEDMNFDLDSINPSTLLKLCRNYSGKHVKSIYLYSQVPGEIRNIKTYSAFLTFLSTNTYSNKEIKGLVLNLRKNLTDPGYLSINIDEDVYMINNILSILNVFARATNIEFLQSLNIKSIRIIGFVGGSIKDLISFLKNISKNLGSEHFEISINYLDNLMLNKFDSKCRSNFLDISSFYYFPKTQKSKSGWYGPGNLIICNKGNIFSLCLYNNLVNSIESNVIGKIEKSDISFILDVLNKCGLVMNNKDITEPRSRKSSDLLFGVDYNGDYSIYKRPEMSVGIKAIFNPILKSVIDDKDFYEISYLSPNSYILNCSNDLNLKNYKIYTLPLIQGEIMNLIKMMFNPEDFEVKLLEGGLNDFEDYILTEIMTDFGYETYVNPYDFLDNYQSSKIYKIFKEVQEKSISNLPKKIQNSIIPASEGSLLRILIDYSRETNEKVIKTPGNLTPEMMELRSQYPEIVSVILSENLIKSHNNIYNEEEREEIKNSYQQLYKYKDKEELQVNVIKLMTHWGFGSLVNSIENYSLAKSDKNYWYFSLSRFDKMQSALSSGLFVKLNSIILESFFEKRDLINDLSLNLPNFKIRNGNLKAFISEYLTFLTNILYKPDIKFCNYNYSYMCFLNMLIGFLEEEEFVTTLRGKMDKDYILCSIEVNYQRRKEFIAFYNSLLFNFININKQSVELDFLRKVEKLDSNIRNPKSFYDMMTPANLKDKIEKFSVGYHNFMNDDLISMFNSNSHVYSNGVDYRISQEVKGKSKFKVKVCEFLKLDHVYNEEVFDTENWDEINSIIEMGDPEQEEIDEYYDELKSKFLKPKTKKLNLKTPTVQSTVTWVIDPYISCKSQNVDFYRQCGENIVLVTTDIIPEFLKFFPNSQLRKVNFSNYAKRPCPNFIAHITSNKLLNRDFWDRMVGGTIIDFDSSMPKKVFMGDYLIREGVIGSSYLLGETFEGLVTKNFSDDVKAGEGSEIETGDSSKSENENDGDKEVVYRERIMDLVNEAVDNGVISRALRWRLIDKYTKSEVTKVNSLEELFMNCMNELNLSKIKCEITSGESKFLNKEDYVKVFQAPTHFGLAQNYSRGDAKNIKDKKVLAEINSLNSKLGGMIASGTLSISESYSNILKSHYRLWFNSIKNTKKKRESKKFLLVLFLSIINSANVLESSVDDGEWRGLVDLITPYVADEDEDDDDSDSDFLNFSTEVSHGSRLMYRASGF